MNYPKRQYVLARKRGSKTTYFHVTTLKELRSRVKEGEEFLYFQLARLCSYRGQYRGKRLYSERVS